MQKYLLALLCLTSIAYADHYKNIEKAVLESSIDTTRTLLVTPLSEKECSQLLVLADSMIEKRKCEFKLNHNRPFLTGKKLLAGYAAYFLAGVATGVMQANNMLMMRGEQPNLILPLTSLSILAAGTFISVTLIRSFLSQATDLEKLYNNALIIKYELELKLRNIQTIA